MLDIKSKNNRSIRVFIVIIVLLLLTATTICILPAVNRNANSLLEEREEEQEGQSMSEETTEALRIIYKGSYVLYQEMRQRQENVTASDLYLEKSAGKKETAGDGTLEEEAPDETITASNIKELIEAWSSEFESCRSVIDYCILQEDGSVEKNTSRKLEEAAEDKNERVNSHDEYYSDCFLLEFDETGACRTELLYGSKIEEDTLIKLMGQIDREDMMALWMENNYGYSMQNLSNYYEFKRPVSFRVIFAVPNEFESQVYMGLSHETDAYSYWQMINLYSDAGGTLLYFGMLFVIALFVLFMTSKKVWKNQISMNRPGKCYLLEAAAIGVICVLCMTNSVIELIWQSNDYCSLAELAKCFDWKNMEDLLGVLLLFGVLFVLYTVWYLSIRFLRPVLTLGVWEYIRQYGLIYQIFPWLAEKWKMFWKAFRSEVEHIDFRDKYTKTIIKIVAFNFVVLAVCSCFWFFGIGALLVYSVVLFYLIKRYVDKIGKDYCTLLQGVSRIAEGELDTEITEDIGVFEPFKEELAKIRFGLGKAVEEEVKSQRMKTELITNVSHDLKTPLTAITTYVELLKKEDITEEERRSYIETLERKALRLKVLIEDLFEVSKATSNNIILNRVEVDVVNLLKQVSVEHTEQFVKAELELRWDVPDERMILSLDSQKTYRIFENLFVNVQKYAMPKSRVYIIVKNKNGMIEIIIKNISADELSIKGEELTERFVRGDTSRNTEGSGLGLAIAKSFTEAQGGKLNVETDGDLFKVVIRFPYVV